MNRNTKCLLIQIPAIVAAVVFLSLLVWDALFNTPDVFFSTKTDEFVSCSSDETKWEIVPIKTPTCQRALQGRYDIIYVE